MLIAIDEADKCPIPIARLIRVISTNLQQLEMNNVRFIVAGVNPYFRKITDEDPGVARFFYKTIHLSSLVEQEAADLLATKFGEVIASAHDEGVELNLDDSLTGQLMRLSGGHPHLLQLLGSHIVEREEDDPDGHLDARDLANALKTICYEDRAHVYESLIHLLEVNGKYEVFKSIIKLSHNLFPTVINRKDVENSFNAEAVQWLIDNNIIYSMSDMEYGLLDEFFRIRLIMDDEASSKNEVESRIIFDQSMRRLDFERDDYYERPVFTNYEYDDDENKSEYSDWHEVEERLYHLRPHQLFVDEINDEDEDNIDNEMDENP